MRGDAILLSFVLLCLVLWHQLERFATLNAILHIAVLVDIFLQVESEEYDKEYRVGLAVLKHIS